MIEGFGTLKSMIESVLEVFPETRGSDTLLCIRIVQKLGGSSIEDLEKINIVSVHKLRQSIQNKEGKYLPSEDVINKRRELEKEIHAYFSNLPTYD